MLFRPHRRIFHLPPKLPSSVGQGRTELMMILALIATAAIGVLATFGDEIRHFVDDAVAAPSGALRRQAEKPVEDPVAGKAKEPRDGSSAKRTAAEPSGHSPAPPIGR